MDHLLRSHGHRLLETLRTRLSKVSGIASKLRIPLWGYLLPLAFFLALWAHRGSSEEGRLGWLAENPPKDEVWNAILLRKGFQPIEDPDWKEKAYAEMPEALRRKDSALISEDFHTVALRGSGEWRYFQLGATSPGKATGAVVKRELWEGLGLGWEAIANLDRIELPLVRTKVGESRQIHQEFRDPRSLQY